MVSFGVIISGGVQRRSAGWKIVASLLAFSGVVQCVGIAIVVRSPFSLPIFCYTALLPLLWFRYNNPFELTNTPPRHTPSTTSPSSRPRAGPSAPRGPSRPPPSPSSSSPRSSSAPAPYTSPKKEATSSSPTIKWRLSKTTSSRPAYSIYLSTHTYMSHHTLSSGTVH